MTDTTKKLTYGDMIDALEAGNWQILEGHYEAKLKRVGHDEAIQEVHDDIVDFTNHHYDGNSKNYQAATEGLRKWEQSKGNT